MVFQFAQKGPVKYVESSLFAEFGFLSHAFLSRWGGVSQNEFANLNFSSKQGDLEANVAGNFRLVEEAFRLPAHGFFLMNQEHGDRVLVLERTAQSQTQGGCHGDAVITAETGIAIGIKTADCVPVLILDPVRKAIGAVHAGWRGTAMRISEKTVATMDAVFASKMADLIAVIGPAIGPCCYEVDSAVADAFRDAGERDAALYPKVRGGRQARWMLDLQAMNRIQLLRAGLLPEHVSSINLCTSCRTDLFFSHRAGHGKTGRQLSFLSLKGVN